MPNNYPQNWPTIAYETKRKAGFRCRACLASSLETPSTQLNVHHIDLNPANNDPSNLVVLCQICHLRLHGIEFQEKKRHQDYFRAIAQGQLTFELPPELTPAPFTNMLDTLIMLAKNDKKE